MNPFDPEQGNHGWVVATVSVTGQRVDGGLYIWYGTHPLRRAIPLLEARDDHGRPEDSLDQGMRRTFVIASDDIAGRPELLDSAWDDAQAPVDFGSVKLTLTSERVNIPIDATVTLESVTLFSGGCACGADELLCGPETPVCDETINLCRLGCPHPELIGEDCEAPLQGRLCRGSWSCEGQYLACRIDAEACLR